MEASTCPVFVSVSDKGLDPLGGCFCQLPLKIDEKEYIQHNSHCRGNRSGKPNLCQAGIWLDAHKVSQR